mmetsp:Transcript_22957/g.42195  ORF Transcript_22957/g.42195 Transcript_22957/m.42195 type:complete len:237 (-) Transcript_22957:61-771(-)
MTLIRPLCDPFVWFCISVVLAPAQELETLSEVSAYFCHWTLWLTALVIGTIVALTTLFGTKSTLTASEERVARWYLLNGTLIHGTLDGCIGLFKANPTYASQYAKIDSRYSGHIGSHESATVHVLCMVELILYVPACIWLYIAYHHRRPERDALELVVCVMQAYGTIVYFAPEVLSGMPSASVDKDLSFTPYYLKYFWFASAMNFVWIIVPGILGKSAWNRIVSNESRLAREVKSD